MGSLYQSAHCTLALQWANRWRAHQWLLLDMLARAVLSKPLLNRVEDLVQATPVGHATGRRK